MFVKYKFLVYCRLIIHFDTDISVDTNNSTALEDVDFILSTSHVTFNPQETTSKVRIHLLKDNFDEVADRIVIQLRNPVGASIKNGSAVVTIAGNYGKVFLISHTHRPFQCLFVYPLKKKKTTTTTTTTTKTFGDLVFEKIQTPILPFIQ